MLRPKLLVKKKSIGCNWRETLYGPGINEKCSTAMLTNMIVIVAIMVASTVFVACHLKQTNRQTDWQKKGKTMSEKDEFVDFSYFWICLLHSFLYLYSFIIFMLFFSLQQAKIATKKEEANDTRREMSLSFI